MVYFCEGGKVVSDGEWMRMIDEIERRVKREEKEREELVMELERKECDRKMKVVEFFVEGI